MPRLIALLEGINKRLRLISLHPLFNNPFNPTCGSRRILLCPESSQWKKDFVSGAIWVSTQSWILPSKTSFPNAARFPKPAAMVPFSRRTTRGGKLDVMDCQAADRPFLARRDVADRNRTREDLMTGGHFSQFRHWSSSSYADHYAHDCMDTLRWGLAVVSHRHPEFQAVILPNTALLSTMDR